MVRRTRGASTLGCLFSILITMVVLYYGVNVGRVWWRYYELVDRMQSAARFAITRPVPETMRRLQADVEALDLPAEAKKFKIQRVQATGVISITTTYQEIIEFPFVRRTVTFNPSVSQRY
jgi:hypothetical protein